MAAASNEYFMSIYAALIQTANILESRCLAIDKKRWRQLFRTSVVPQIKYILHCDNIIITTNELQDKKKL